MADISQHFPRLLEAIDHLTNEEKAAILSELADQGPGTATGLTEVTIAAGTTYLSIDGQEITGEIVPVTSGGTGSTDAASARTALGLGTAAEADTTAFAPVVHTHATTDITGLDTAISGNAAVTANTAKISFPGLAGNGAANTAARSDHSHTATDIGGLDAAITANTAVTANTAKDTFPGFAGNGVAETSSRSDHSHTASEIGGLDAAITSNTAVTTNTAKTSFPGFAGSGTDNTASRTDHTHTASQITDFDAEVANNPAVTLNTAKTGITTAQADAITANTAKVGITTAQATDITANTTARHAAVTIAGEDYLSLSGQAITANEVDLSDNVTGTLPLNRINQTELNTRIDERASAVGSVNIKTQAEFDVNTVTWQIGDILIITDTNVTYLYVGENNAMSTDLADFQQITTPGGGISQAIADMRYSAIGHTHTASEVTDFATAVSTNTAVAANTAKTGITAAQASEITANTAKVTFPGFGDTATTAAAGDHTHTASDITDFDTEVSNNTDVTANTAKTSFPGFGTTATTAATGNHTHTASQITDFDTEVSNNTSVTANTAKVTFPGFGTTATTAAAGNHTHTVSDITDFATGVSGNSAVTANTAKTSFPGFGTDASTAAVGNHTHVATDITDFTNAVNTNTNVAANTTARHAAVTLGNTNYLSLSGQEITGGTVPVTSGGTGATTNTAARTNLDVDQLGRVTITDRTGMAETTSPLQFELISNGGTPSGAGWITFELQA